ncbi:MAG: TonB-dependent receptor plug domain-containing protein, partial [Halobacteriales archaeon]|nr:TonB-dependent receptor plug domain-containing protein [Halobacteriales archaeon]
EAVALEGITVLADRERIDVSDASVVDMVTREQIEELPALGRDFTDFINLSALVAPQPGVTTGGQFSIGGARTSGTQIQIDGADANNAFFGENRGSSRIPFTFSLESIREFQIITNGFDVEYGKFSGGLINAVTKSGTNETQGNAFVFWRDETLTADNFNDQAPSDFQSFQFGGVLSGPIIEDKLHYFVSADLQQRNQPTFALDPQRANLSQATLDEFQSILTSVYGFSESEIADDFGTFDETDDQIALFGRLDWAMNPDHRLSFRINYSDFENQNDRISSSGLEARTRGGTFIDEAISAVAELNSTFGDGIFNTLRVQYSSEDRPRPGNSRLPSVEVEGVTNQDGRDVTLGWGGSFFGI